MPVLGQGPVHAEAAAFRQFGDCGPDKAGCSGYRGWSALNPIGSQKKSIINEESDQAAEQYAQDGAEAFPEGEGEHAEENEDAHVIDEVVMVHHHDGHRGDQGYRNELEAVHHAAHDGIVAVLEQEGHDDPDYEKGGEADGDAGQKGAGDAHADTAIGIESGIVAYVSGGVDADRAGGHLAEGHDVGKLLMVDPGVGLHDVVLHQREHGVAATEA